MMNRSVVIVPVERVTDVARIVRVATAIAASPVDVHLVQVMTADGLWRDGTGGAWTSSAWTPGRGGSAPAQEKAQLSEPSACEERPRPSSRRTRNLSAPAQSLSNATTARLASGGVPQLSGA